MNLVIDKAATLRHYTRMAAAIAVTDEDDESLDEFQADDIAREELLRTPCNLTFWLEHQSGTSTEPLTVGTETIWEITHCDDVPRLLALVFDGSDAQIVNAARRLRDIYLTAHAKEVSERAAELMKEPA
jgi:hypothetical protein